MKKVKITAKPEQTQGVSFRLFDSIEHLCSWMAHRPGPAEQHGAENIHLKANGYLEAELMGYEYVYGSQDTVKFDFVRIVEVHPTQNSSAPAMKPYTGWITADMFTFRNFDDAQIDCHVLGPDEEQLDFSVVFKDD